MSEPKQTNQKDTAQKYGKTTSDVGIVALPATVEAIHPRMPLTIEPIGGA